MVSALTDFDLGGGGGGGGGLGKLPGPQIDPNSPALLPTMATTGGSTGTSPNPLINAGVNNNLGGDNMPIQPMDLVPSGIPIPSAAGGALSAPSVTSPFPNANITPNATDLGHDFISVSPQSPDFTKALFGYLQSMIGKGATPYGGQLSAGQNNLLQQLVTMLSGGQSSIPGAGTLTDMATTGDPINQMPAWQAMVDAAQRSISQGRANLRESFAFGGNLAGSPFGTASADYESQTAKDLNAQLEQMTASALENAAGRKLNASEFTSGLASDTSKYVQGLDQAALDRLYQEFMRTQPEYSPLLNLQYGAATTYPPTLHPPAGLGILGALLGNAGGIAGALSQLGLKLPGAPPAQPTTGTQYPRPTPQTPSEIPGQGSQNRDMGGYIQGPDGMWMPIDSWYNDYVNGPNGVPISDNTANNQGWGNWDWGITDPGSGAGAPESYSGGSGGGSEASGGGDWWDMSSLGDFAAEDYGGY